MNDIINAAFELLGCLFILNHCRVAVRDKQVKGVSIISVAFFSVWGVWNLWFYPSLGQWWSFICGGCVAIANTAWVMIMLRYR